MPPIIIPNSFSSDVVVNHHKLIIIQSKIKAVAYLVTKHINAQN